MCKYTFFILFAAFPDNKYFSYSQPCIPIFQRYSKSSVSSKLKRWPITINAIPNKITNIMASWSLKQYSTSNIITLKQAHSLVGRCREAQVFLPSTAVSRSHANLFLMEGHLWIQALHVSHRQKRKFL